VHGTSYYYHGGNYYQPAMVGGAWQYTVVAAPIGAAVVELPNGATTTVVGGVNYYTIGGAYYRRSYVNGEVQFVVVAPPT
jgi:hypothetical protein